MALLSPTGKVLIPLPAAQIPIPLATHPVGFPSTKVERMLSLEFRLWFSHHGPVRLVDMSDDYLARAMRAAFRGAGVTPDIEHARYFLAWARLFAAERRRREAQP